MPGESRESGQRIETDRVVSVESSRIGRRGRVEKEGVRRKGVAAAIDGDEGDWRGDSRDRRVVRGERQVAGFNRQVVTGLVRGRQVVMSASAADVDCRRTLLDADMAGVSAVVRILIAKADLERPRQADGQHRQRRRQRRAAQDAFQLSADPHTPGIIAQISFARLGNVIDAETTGVVSYLRSYGEGWP